MNGNNKGVEGVLGGVLQKPMIRVSIDVLQDGRVEVLGFPSNFGQAMDIMAAGIRRVAGYFLGMAQDGKVDKDGNLEQPRIIQSGPPVPPIPIDRKVN